MLLRQQVHVLAPIFLAGVLHHENDLAPAAQSRQGLNHLHGQIGDTKHHNARRQTFRFVCLGMLNLAHELRVHLCPGMALRGKFGDLILKYVLQQQLPQLSLPNLIGGHGFVLALVLQHTEALSPIAEPIGSVALVAVKDIGHLLGQLITLPPQGIVFDVGQQSFHLVCFGKLWQQTPQAPNQSLFVKWHGHWHQSLT